MVDHVHAGRLREAGFTLIELLIVIVILGVLAATVVFSVNGIQDRGKKAACQADRATVQRAVEASYAQSGTYPSSVAALVPNFLRTTPAAGRLTYTASSGALVYGADCIATGLVN